MNQKDALLAGAKQCLIEKGYGKTTARDIAEASGSHLGSIGYHYGSKDKLMNRAAMELSSEWGDTISQAMQQARGEAPHERLVAALAAIVKSLPQTRDVQSASLQAFTQAQFDDSLSEHISAGAAQARRAFGALLAGKDEHTTADLTDAESGLGSLTYALTAGLAIQSLVDPENVPDSQQLKAAIELLGQRS